MEEKKKQNEKSNSTPVTVGDMIIHYLKLEGVDHVFGIPGGGLMQFLVNLKNHDDEIHYVICRQETGAAYMADGYFRATGKLGVVAVTTGPGATNALTGVMNAQADGSALLLITGEIDEQFDGMGYLQEGVDAPLNIDAVYAAATAFSHSITAGSNSETIFKQALRDILSTPRKAAHLSLPVNVTVESVKDPTLPDSTSAYRTELKGAPIGEVKKALETLLKCKRPMLFLGNGCRQALRDKRTARELKHFVETYAIPVMTTADGKGIFPESHDLSLRVYGIADCLWPYYYLTQEEPAYDGVMVIGSSLGELSTNKWSPILLPKAGEKAFIQVDINPRIIARSFEITQGVVGEAKSFIHDMAHLMVDLPVDEKAVEARRDFIAGIKKDHSPYNNPDGYNSTTAPIHPAALMRVLQETMPQNSKIFIDAGNCVGWSVHYLVIEHPTEIFTSLSMGPMGFAVGAVVGGKHGCPDDTVMAITGDGAFMMQGSEVSTARQNNIGAIWIVLDDNNLSMVSQGMSHFFPDEKNPNIWHELYELGRPDLVKYSEGLGADAYRVSDPEGFKKIMPTVLKRANEDNVPQVIVVEIDRKPIPPYYNPMYAPKKK